MVNDGVFFTLLNWLNWINTHTLELEILETFFLFKLLHTSFSLIFCLDFLRSSLYRLCLSHCLLLSPISSAMLECSSFALFLTYSVAEWNCHVLWIFNKTILPRSNPSTRFWIWIDSKETPNSIDDWYEWLITILQRNLPSWRGVK